MSTAGKAVDRNVDGILNHMRDYLRMREEQAARVNPKIAGIIDDIVWVQTQNLRHLLLKSKAFGGEKFRVADVLAGPDENKRRALLGTTDQNSIVSEVINRGDEQGKRVADLTIHDMRTLFRMIDPALENIIQLIQHWMYWDIPDAADMHQFDEQERRLETIRNMELTDELRGKYRPALGKTIDEPVSDSEVFGFELKRLESICAKFTNRANEAEPYQMIIGRDEATDGEPYDYKKMQADSLRARLEAAREAVNARLSASTVAPAAEASVPVTSAVSSSAADQQATETPAVAAVPAGEVSEQPL